MTAAMRIADDRPIVVGGCHRSGTSLMRRILNAHSRIYCGPEVKFFLDLYGDHRDDRQRFARFLPSALHMVSSDDLLDVVGAAFVRVHEHAAAREGKERWADKNPENVFYLNQWQRLLGERWLFIQVARNPLDTLASIKEANFSSAVPPALNQRIDFYRRCIEDGLRFRDRSPHRCRLILYEDLVRDPRSTLSGLMEWLGETLETRQLHPDSTRDPHGLEDPKVKRTSRIHDSSVGRWTELLTLDEAERIWTELRDLWLALDEEGRFETSDPRGDQERYAASLGSGSRTPVDEDAIWSNRVLRAAREICSVVPAGHSFVLIDEDQWGMGPAIDGRPRLAFPALEGAYSGRPSDETRALRELHGLVSDGTRYVIVGWPAFWWLDYYGYLSEYLHSHGRTVYESSRLIAFELSVPPSCV